MSDFHGALPEVTGLPEADLVLLGGDYCWDHDDFFFYNITLRHFIEDLYKRYKNVVGIAGNHDFWMEKDYRFFKEMPWHYLCDEEITLQGMRIWGAPWSNKFGEWAFMRTEYDLIPHWEGIKPGVDILLTHGPAQGYGDLVPRGTHVGSKGLQEAVERVKPKIHCYGHIHEGYGIHKNGETISVNAARMNGAYSPINPPIVVEL